MESKKSIAVSGGFDPIHVGHVRMILDAAKHGDVYVILNSDEWLIRKKGYAFMKWEERSEIIRSITGVTDVVHAEALDGTVCDDLRNLHREVGLDYFANGGDRILSNTPEMNVCEELKISMLWNVGGGKIQSSSHLVNQAEFEKNKIENIIKKYSDK